MNQKDLEDFSRGIEKGNLTCRLYISDSLYLAYYTGNHYLVERPVPKITLYERKSHMYNDINCFEYIKTTISDEWDNLPEDLQEFLSFHMDLLR